jgi:choline dehydrogenase
VILAGGAFNSPQLLMLSGIGRARELESAGVAPLHDLPGVGKNLQDHPLVMAGYQASGPHTFDDALRVDRLCAALLRWTLNGSGPLGTHPLTVQGFLRTHSNGAWPDTQFHVSHASWLARPWFPGWRRGAGHHFTAAGIQLHPGGTGEVTLRSADPRDPPRIRLGLLTDEGDRRAAREMLRFIRQFFATEPASTLVSAELAPGPGVKTEAQLDTYIRSTIQTGMHPTGTCAMGTDARAVVDSELKVHGIRGLRVVDASVMPRIVGGNTSAPTMMIAEKASDLILGGI